MTSMTAWAQQYQASYRPRALLQEIGLREMIRTPAVLITVIICSTVLAISIVGVVAWLSYASKESTAVLLVIAAFVVPVLGAIYARLTVVDRQTNGHTTRLMDAVIDKAAGVASQDRSGQ